MIIILDNLRSALNVGSIIRTCDALGIKQIWFCGITPGPENSKVHKTSLGAERGITAREFGNMVEALSELKKMNLPLIALELTDEAISVDTAKTEGEFALVVGNEVSGVSPEAIKASDKVVKIPMQGTKESMNVAVAFGIAAYVLGRQNT